MNLIPPTFTAQVQELRDVLVIASEQVVCNSPDRLRNATYALFLHWLVIDELKRNSPPGSNLDSTILALEELAGNSMWDLVGDLRYEISVTDYCAEAITDIFQETMAGLLVDFPGLIDSVRINRMIHAIGQLLRSYVPAPPDGIY